MAFEMNKFFRLAKVDEATHEVWGIATSEIPDKDNEIADYAESKKAFKVWSDEFFSKTSAAGQEPSLGNIRLQHGLEIAGKAIKLEYRDADKQIWLGTQPVNDEIWKLIKGGFVTGYSMGGSYAWKKPDGNYTRFAPTISEVSYVDNPCNPDASFAYVKADGGVEMRKFSSTVTKQVAVPLEINDDLVERLAKRVAAALAPPKTLFVEEAELEKDGKTKKKGGKELHASDFAYVGDPDDTSTWKLPVHDAAHARNALARFGETKDIPADKKAAVRAKIVAAAKQHGVEVSDKSMTSVLKKAEIVANKSTSAILLKVVNGSMAKGMWQVASMAHMLEDLYFLCMSTKYESEVEEDNSPIPDELKASLKSLVDTFLSLAEEETEELTSAVGGLGGMTMSVELTDLQKAELAKAKSIHDMLDGLHKSSHDYHDEMIAQHDKCAKMHKDRKEAVTDGIMKLKKALGEGGASAEGMMDADGAIGAKPHAGSAHEGKTATTEGLTKADVDKAVSEALVKAQTEAATAAKTKEDELLKVIKDLTDRVEAMGKTVEETKTKQTLVGRDGKEINKTAKSGDVMSDTGL